MSLIPQKDLFLTEANGGAPEISEWGQNFRLAGLKRTAAREDITVYGIPSGVHPASPMFPGFIGIVGAHYVFTVPVTDPDLYWLGQVPIDAVDSVASQTLTAWEQASSGSL
jgi:hypothetical protein